MLELGRNIFQDGDDKMLSGFCLLINKALELLMINNRIADLLKESKEHNDKVTSLFAESNELHQDSLSSPDTSNRFEITQRIISKIRESLREMEKVREVQSELIKTENKGNA
jgi:hypothetical protein